jgi:biotin synthase
MAGANAIFTGERMLTTPCSGWDQDKAMLDRWGLRGQRSFEDQESVSVNSSAMATADAAHTVAA